MPPRIRRRITSARREQIEKEQEQLSRAIVRPFEVLSGLPVSFSQPPNGHYEDVLKNPLTIKDTGVLYRSLMKSRFTYIHVCPLFTLYWVKQSSYAKKLAEQDKPLPKSSKEDHFADRKPVLGYDVSARDVMVKLCDAKMTLGPHVFEIRLFIAKDGRSERPKKDYTQNNQFSQPPQPMPQSDSSTIHKPTLPLNKVSEIKKDEVQPTEPTVEKPPSEPKRPLDPPSEPAPPKNDPNNMQSIDNTIMISNLNAIARSDDSLNKLMKVVALGSATPQQIITFQGYIKRAREMGPQPHHAYLYSNIPGGIPKKKLPKERKEKRDKVPKDQKLTAFQERYLNDAMLLFEYVENPNVRFTLPQDAICEVLDPEYPDEEDEDYDAKDVLVSFLWIHNQSEIDKYNRDLAVYKQKVKEREDEEKRLEEEKKKQEEKEREEREEREKKEGNQGKNEVVEKAEVETEEVGAIQEKENAETEEKNEDAAVEETENQNKLSNDSQDGEPKNGEDTKEGETGEENESKDETSKKEVTEETAEEAAEAAAVEASEASGEPSEEVKKEETEVSEVKDETGQSKRVPPSRKLRNKKRRPPPRKAPAPKKLEPPVEPETKFTAVSYTLHGIPSKFIPIIVNSFKPLNEVQSRMTEILKNGTRVPSFYLWYQVDGKLDEALADDVRVQLVQEEKRMTGIQASDKAKEKELAKKRKLKEKEAKAKKVKLETEYERSQYGPMGMNHGINNSGTIGGSSGTSVPLPSVSFGPAP